MSYSINLKLIRQKRIENKLTMQDMAEVLGLSGKSDYSKRETGDTRFRSTEIPVISKKLRIPLSKIFKKNVEKIETK